MNNDKMREDFEKDYGLEYLKKDEEGNYIYWHSKIAWEYFQKGWQASRAALVVELPLTERHKDQNRDGYCYRVDRIKDALGKAGIKYE